jgi:archaellum component FlaC
MAEKVTVRQAGGQIDGAQFENAASEVTLIRVAEAIEKLDKKLGGKGGGKDQVQSMFNQALAGNAKQLDNTTNRSAVFGDILGKTGDQAKSFGSSLASAAGSIISSGLGMAFGAIAAGSMKLAEVFTEGLDAWREASSVGAGFNNSLMDLQRSAAAAHMPLDVFVGVIKQNSNMMAVLGGTVTSGADRFGKLNKELTDVAGAGGNLFALGYTAKDVSEGLASYLDIQQKSGRLAGRTNAELVAGSIAYLEQMDGLARATGVTRKQQEEMAKKASIDPVIQSLMDGLDDDARLKANANMVQMTEMGGEKLLEAMKSAAARVPNAYGKLIQAQTGWSAEKFQEFFKGMDPAEAREKIIEIGKAFDLKGPTGELKTALVASRSEFADYSTSARMIAQNAKKDVKKADEERAMRDGITKGMASFGQVITDISSSIKEALFNSKVFEKFEATFRKVMDIFTSSKVQDSIGKFFTNLIDGVDQSLMDGDLIGALKSAFRSLIDGLKPIIGEFFKGLFESPAKSAKRKELEDRKSSIRSGMGRMPEGAREGAQSQIEDINKQLKDLENENSDPFGGILESITSVIPGFQTILDIIDGVKWAFENWGKVLLGAGGVVVGLMALSSLIGGAGSGLGGAIGGLAKGIGSGLSSLSKSIGDTMSSLSKGIGDLIANLSKGVGDAIANISKGIGTGLTSILTGIATGLKAFANGATITGLAVFSVGVGVVTLAMMGLGKALEYAAPGIEALSPILVKIADVIGNVVVKAFDTLKDIANIFLDGFKAIPDIFERLANIGGTSLIGTAAGIAAIGGSLAVFALGGSLASLVSGTGLINLAEGLKTLGQVDGTMLEKLAPPLEAISKPLALLGGSSVLALIGGNSLSTLATSLKAFEEIDPSKIANVGPALEGLHKALSLFTGGNEGLFSSIGTALGSLVKGDNGLGKLAESFKAFNVVDGANLNNVATGMNSLKTSIGDDLSKQADGVKTFADSIKSLSTNIKDLQTSLEKLNKTPGGPQAATAAAGAASQGGNDGSVTTNASTEKLEKLNTLVTELVSVAKETRDFNKDQVDAIKDRGSAMGRK